MTSIKVKLNSISNRIESTKTVSKEVETRLLDIETKNLEQNLLFFAIDEKPKADSVENGGENGNKNRNKNGDEKKVDEVVENGVDVII